MSLIRQIRQLREKGHTDSHSTAADLTETGVFDDVTVDCYRRRQRLLSETYRTEWWMAIAVLVVIASIGLVLL